ncbi:flagellar motor switch phosphatase FliY [Robertmurraya sp. P23]|uniref:flagellar motor switch phosphatase FliY n=1 Tax=Robertmurraya sp. P23 TaxID=3436931 RepID=UPI003D956DAE
MVSDGMLSQDEIDALLRGTDEPDNDMAVKEEAINVEDYLSSMEQDALGEIGNISFGSSATALSTLLNQKVDITTPSVVVIPKSRLAEEFPQPYVAIQVSYTEGFSGTNLLVIQQSDAAIIADLMLGGDGIQPADLMGEIQLSAVQEAMNQMMGSSATSMSTIFSKKVDISPPSIDILNVLEGEGTDRLPVDDMLVKISFRLKVGDLIDSSIMQLVPLEFAKGLVEELLNPSPTNEMESDKIEDTKDPGSNDLSEPTPIPSASHQPPMQGGYGGQMQPPTQAHSNQEQWGQVPPLGVYQAPINQAYPQGPQHFGSPYASIGAQPNVQPASFSSFEQYPPLQQSESKNLDMLLDIPLQVTVELGRTRRSVKEILELSSGSIIELDKLAGEPVDILVNNRLIAKGEVVVIDENFGVRVTDIISQSDRIKKLR